MTKSSGLEAISTEIMTMPSEKTSSPILLSPSSELSTDSSELENKLSDIKYTFFTNYE
jgi:hypothetical protein